MLAEMPLAPWLRFDRDFIALAHRHQEPPAAANNGGPWTTWLMLGGRGAGKTRAGAEWVRAQALGLAPYAAEPARNIALIGETWRDVREVMIEGPSACCACRRAASVRDGCRRGGGWNGATARWHWRFPREDAEQLRGPQFDAAWCDELAKWPYADAAWDMLQFGLRLGTRPRQLRHDDAAAARLIKRLVADPRTAVTRAGTHANAAHLSPAFLGEVIGRYAGTQLGRQELEAELIEDRADALWTRGMIEAARVREAPPLQRIVIDIDPPGSARPGADACGIVAAGLAEDGRIYVLERQRAGWRRGLGERRWLCGGCGRCAGRRGQPGRRHGARVLAQIDPALPLRTVHATRGKWLRAEPVAMLYAQGKVKHVDPPMPALEDEMADFGLDGLSSGASPDRLDALVWAVTELTSRSSPRKRGSKLVRAIVASSPSTFSVSSWTSVAISAST